MDSRGYGPGQRGQFRGGFACAVSLALVAGALAIAGMPAIGAAAPAPARVMEAVGPNDIGPDALVNTLGLRATTFDTAGQYVTIAAGQPRLRARVANQLFTEFGVFRDVKGRFRLLGADGRWVSVRLHRASKEYRAGTWASRWAAAWSFKLKRPTEFGFGVVHDLADMRIDSDEVLCVLAYSPLGAPRGLLAVSERGTMLVDGSAACGASTAGLFITDSVTKSMSPAALAKGVPIDPITSVRFVAPDRRALTLSVARRRMVRNEIIEYFDKLANYNDLTHGQVVDAVHTTALQLLTESYVIPGDQARDIDLVDFFVKRASYVLDIIPIYGAIASGALKATYDTVQLGIALAHNANLEGPRVVEGVSNRVLTTAADIKTEYDNAFLHFGMNIERLRDSLLEGCNDPTTCVSDRKLAAWWRADPTKNITDEVRRLTREHEVAAHELVVWRRLLPIRGRLHVPNSPLRFMPHQAGAGNCDVGYPYNSAFRNDDILDKYAPWVTAPDATWGLPVAVTGLFYPYYNWYTPDLCWGEDIFRPYISGWVLALANNDASAMTPVARAWRLFDRWNPAEPVTSGFGLSRSEVACGWLTKPANAYMGEHHYYFNPCHAAFYGADGALVSPYQDEDGHYDDAIEYASVFWTPCAAEVAAGRSVANPDVVSPLVPDFTFRSCAAFQAGAVKSVPGGVAIRVYFTNLFDGDVEVHRIKADGSTVLVRSLPRQSQLARPLGGASQFGPLELHYSAPVDTTAGTSFVVTRPAGGACVGAWTAKERPAGSPVGYAIIEVHGNDGILGN